MARMMRYKPHNGATPIDDNPFPGMAAFLMSNRVQEMAMRAARATAATAASLTPRSDKDGDHLADHFEAAEIEPQVFDGNPRRAAQVQNRKRYAAAVEFGSATVIAGGVVVRRNRPVRMLARAAALHGEFHPGRSNGGPG